MQKIYVVTGNLVKRQSFENALIGCPVDLQMIDPESYGILEPQIDDVLQVSKSKAEQAWLQLKQPCLVEDGGLYISALNGFPGAFSKHVLETLSVEGLFKLMEGVENRNVYFKGSIYYIDSLGKGYSFVEESHGTFSNYISEPHLEQWSEAWRIFTPDGFDKTLADFTKKEYEIYQLSCKQNMTNRWIKLHEHLLNELS